MSAWNRTPVHLIAFPFNNCHDAYEVNVHIHKGKCRFGLVKAQFAMGDGYNYYYYYYYSKFSSIFFLNLSSFSTSFSPNFLPHHLRPTIILSTPF